LQRVGKYEMQKLEDLRKFSPKSDGKLSNAIIRMAKKIGEGSVSKQTTFLSKLDRIGLAREGMEMIEYLVKQLVFQKMYGQLSSKPADAIKQAGMMQRSYLQWRDRKEFKVRQLAKFSQFKDSYSSKDEMLGISITIDQVTEQVTQLKDLINLLVVDVLFRLPTISASVTDHDYVQTRGFILGKGQLTD
jgi:hypothetical protein